jgi:pyruvate/2-oxoglutarate/acetoin dehydrogenase E1 component
MKYKDELTKAMTWLAEKESTVFLGQACAVSGNAISGTLEGVPIEKKIELPVFEETQLGLATGMALEGFTTITMYPRFDFFILACNQLVNHLDKMNVMSKGKMKPRVIIRVVIGSKYPIDAGPQHTQNHTDAIKKMLTYVELVELTEAKDIFPAFKKAYERKDSKPTLFIEHGEYYGTK